MTKHEFWDDLQEIVTDKIYIGSTIEEIDKEISNNCWSISITQEQCNELKEEDFTDFFEKVINNRKGQIKDSKYNNGMIFYLWFEQQSGRLRFNLISDFHKRLPFKCELIEVNLNDIVTEFLKYKYHDGIPVTENEENEVDSIETDKNSDMPKMRVFSQYLSK